MIHWAKWYEEATRNLASRNVSGQVRVCTFSFEKTHSRPRAFHGPSNGLLKAEANRSSHSKASCFDVFPDALIDVQAETLYGNGRHPSGCRRSQEKLLLIPMATFMWAWPFGTPKNAPFGGTMHLGLLRLLEAASRVAEDPGPDGGGTPNLQNQEHLFRFWGCIVGGVQQSKSHKQPCLLRLLRGLAGHEMFVDPTT